MNGRVWNEELLVGGAGNAPTAAAARMQEVRRVESAYARGITRHSRKVCFMVSPDATNEAGRGNLHTTVITVSWATCIPGVIPAGEALESALPAVAYGAGTAKALETALTGWP